MVHLCKKHTHVRVDVIRDEVGNIIHGAPPVEEFLRRVGVSSRGIRVLNRQIEQQSDVILDFGVNNEWEHWKLGYSRHPRRDPRPQFSTE